MEAYALIGFFGVMLLLAAIPSGSVGFVVVSSATRGLPCGVAAALGIVVGDLIFVALALLGMTALAEAMGALFALLRYLGGAYLIWMGIGLIRSAKQPPQLKATVSRRQLWGSFHAALLLTLGDLKAILFYASLFPVLIDLEALTPGWIGAIIGMTALTVGGVKLLYAFLANRIASRLENPKWQTGVRRLAGGAMIGAGGCVLLKG